MSALPYPTYGLHHLYLFPVFQTREAYQQATGMEPPPYDPTQPLKSWFDPSAHSSASRKIIYASVIAYAENGSPLAGPDGKPVLEPMMLDKNVAATVNIPLKGGGLPDEPTTGEEIPVPLRSPFSGEELYFQFGGSIAVKNTEMFQQLNGSSSFTAADRSLLEAIAAKLGVAR